MKSIAVANGIPKKQVKEAYFKEGDLGIVVEQVALQLPHDSVKLTFIEVFESFRLISKSSGSNSVILKQNIIVNLLSKASPAEAKFIIRWLVGNLKTGAGEKTIISALARALVFNNFQMTDDE